MQKRIFFLVPYPLHSAPSQRFRFEQYFTLLKSHEITFTVQSFLTQKNWKTFYLNSGLLNELFALTVGFAKRTFVLFRLGTYDFVFIHREAAPIGPPVFEWIISKLLKKKIIYDFDDAIWMADGIESKFLKLVKFRSKVGKISSWAFKVSCGNQYLADYAIKFNMSVVVNPTTIDTENHHNLAKASPIKVNEKLTIGWTGSHSTLKYLTDVESVLMRIEKKFDIRFVVIADRRPNLNLKSLEFVEWSEKTEIRDLMQVDIGIMPLPNNQWAQGKCGFKLLQYMALEIPSVASAVGVNSIIIDDGINGILANSSEEWERALELLIGDKELGKKLGRNARSKIIFDYSVDSNSSTFLSLFE